MAFGFITLLDATPGADWVPLITQYGPGALFVFITLYLIKTRPQAGSRKLNSTIVATMWGCVFLLVLVIVAAWWKTTFHSEFVIKGRIENLHDPEFITTSEPVYLNKRPTAGKDFEYQWRYIDSTKPSGSFELILEPDPKGVTVFKYKVPIDNAFFDGSDVVLALNQSGGMMLTHNSTTLTINAETDNLASVASEQRGAPAAAWLAVVEAAGLESASIETLIAALDADDPIIRANAKRALAARGAAAIPALAGAIHGNYRVQVEVLATLSKMSAGDLARLPQDARCTIFQLAVSSDALLRSSAQSVLGTGLSTNGCRR